MPTGNDVDVNSSWSPSAFVNDSRNLEMLEHTDGEVASTGGLIKMTRMLSILTQLTG